MTPHQDNQGPFSPLLSGESQTVPPTTGRSAFTAMEAHGYDSCAACARLEHCSEWLRLVAAFRADYESSRTDLLQDAEYHRCRAARGRVRA